MLLINAFAKINLTLDVYGKRDDGYHDLISVMQAISLHDTLKVSLTDSAGIHFTCDSDPEFNIPADGTNLVVRAAAQTLQALEKSAQGAAIHLIKNIPAQAGLGGGSSDAAVAILAVNQLHGNRLSIAELSEISASLGSDVPFFLMGGTAVAAGRGEQLVPLPDIPRTWLVVVKPKESVSTSWAYGMLDSLRDRESHEASERMVQAIESMDTARILASQCNDFEPPVFDHFPGIAWLHDELRMAGALTAHLCGSGAAVYGIMENEGAADRALKLLNTKYTYSYKAHTLSRAESISIREADA